MKSEDPDKLSIPPDGSPDSAQPRWRQQFPIDWPRDDFRSRRDFTKLLGLTSLAFVVGQAWIVLLSLRRRRSAAGERDIAAVSEIPAGGSKIFEYPAKGDTCVLVRLPDGRFVAYGQKCTHLSCAVRPRVDEGILQCPCHEGSFDLASGRPIAGPPRRPLSRVRLEVRGGEIFATAVEDRTA